MTPGYAYRDARDRNDRPVRAEQWPNRGGTPFAWSVAMNKVTHKAPLSKAALMKALWEAGYDFPPDATFSVDNDDRDGAEINDNHPIVIEWTTDFGPNESP